MAPAAPRLLEGSLHALPSPRHPAQVLDRVRKVAAAKGKHLAMMLDTKGPEIRTAMLRGGKDIQIIKGQQVQRLRVAGPGVARAASAPATWRLVRASQPTRRGAHALARHPHPTLRPPPAGQDRGGGRGVHEL
jgi:hypothetical protein